MPGELIQSTAAPYAIHQVIQSTGGTICYTPYSRTHKSSLLHAALHSYCKLIQPSLIHLSLISPPHSSSAPTCRARSSTAMSAYNTTTRRCMDLITSAGLAYGQRASAAATATMSLPPASTTHLGPDPGQTNAGSKATETSNLSRFLSRCHYHHVDRGCTLACRILHWHWH
jgi:hypothetical protein